MAEGVRLEWNGKRPARTEFDPLPELRPVAEIGSPPGTGANRLIQGDNLLVMGALGKEMAGKIDLIYLDPPFCTGRQWHSRDAAPGSPVTFTDSWRTPGDYLQWLFDRLTAAHALLSEQGSLYLHLGWQAAAHGRLLLDEVFGPERYQNEIAWCYREAINSRKRWNRKHDTILFYSRGESFTFNSDRVLLPYSETTIRKYRCEDDTGPYRLMGRGITGSPLRSKRDLAPEMETLFPELTFRHYLGEGTLPVDYWNIDIENQASRLRTGYPTQKPEALLERILLASSNPGDLIADLCCGSGTTLAVAHRLGRRWIGCDLGDEAVKTTASRLSGLGAAYRLETLSQPQGYCSAPGVSSRGDTE